MEQKQKIMLKITPNPESLAENPPPLKRKRGRPRKTNSISTPQSQAKKNRKSKNICPPQSHKGKGGAIGGKEKSPKDIDINANNTVSKHNAISPVSDDKVIRIIEYLKDGYTISDTAVNTGITERTIYRWIADNTHNAGQVYTCARATRAARQAAELDKIAKQCDESSNAAVNKARLRCDVIRWQLEKHYPDLYGDTRRIELKADVSAPTRGAAAVADAQYLASLIFADDSDNPPPAEVADAEIIEG